MVGCQTGAMAIDNASEPHTDQGITGGTTAVFSMKQAAEVAGISVSTLRRRRTDLIAAGADISPDGWKVPITALAACGLISGEGPEAASRPAPVTPRSEEGHEASRQSRQIEELAAQMRELERDVNEWRRRAEVAEARAEERGRALDALRLANETERMALRMLTAGTAASMPTPPREASDLPSASPASTAQPPTSDERHFSPQPEPTQRKGFFSRVMGL